MFQAEDTIVLESLSTEVEAAPEFESGSTHLWLDPDGYVQTVEVIDSEPRGWGWSTIQWRTNGGWHVTSTPSNTLMDLDSFLDSQPDYGRFEADDYTYDNSKDERAEHLCGQHD